MIVVRDENCLGRGVEHDRCGLLGKSKYGLINSSATRSRSHILEHTSSGATMARIALQVRDPHEVRLLELSVRYPLEVGIDPSPLVCRYTHRRLVLLRPIGNLPVVTHFLLPNFQFKPHVNHTHGRRQQPAWCSGGRACTRYILNGTSQPLNEVRMSRTCS